MNWNNGNVTLTHEADKLSFEGASSGYIFSDGNVGIGSRTSSHLLTIAGDTNIKYLNDNGVRIWDEWADRNGDLGPIYGQQWRHWQAAQGSEIDQIAQLSTT